MTIDWFTTGAQIVNFLVLLWLLNRFLYGPVLRAIDAREEAIAESLQSAADASSQAEAERDSLAKARAELAETRQQKIDAAKRDADALKQEMVDSARAEITKERAAWREGLARQKHDFAREAATLAGRRVADVAAAALSALAGQDLMRPIVGRFCEMIGQLGEDDRADLAAALADTSGTLKTSTPIMKADMKRIQTALDQLTGSSVSLVTETVESMPPGIRLEAGGIVVDWTSERFLEHFAIELEAELDGQSNNERQGAPEGSAVR